MPYKTYICDPHASPGPSLLPASLSVSRILPVLKYDRAAGGLESTSRCCCRCQLPLMVIPWKWTLLHGQRRQSGKVPIIFAAIDASCQASSDKSAESAVRPASVPEALTRQRVMSRNVRRSKFSVPFPLLHFVAKQSSYSILLFDSTIFHYPFSELVETNINNFRANHIVLRKIICISKYSLRGHNGNFLPFT